MADPEFEVRGWSISEQGREMSNQCFPNLLNLYKAVLIYIINIIANVASEDPLAPLKELEHRKLG